jgi:uncharacterized membrane protein
MSQHELKQEEITQEEIKKEFQLERMILFSDAVFAIVITLLAIELKLPEGEISAADLGKKIMHLLPNFIAYAASFFFIGSIWYEHLKMFSVLKDYDRGLIVRNLFLLFFIGLFPFSATVIARIGNSMASYLIYLIVILLTLCAQYFLYQYIIVQRPELRNNANLSIHLEELKKKRISLIVNAILLVLIIITYFVIPNPKLKTLSFLWMAIMPIFYKLLLKKKKK